MTEINSYVERKEEVKKQIVTLLKKNGIMTKVELHNITGAGYATLDKIFQQLSDEGKILIARYESFGDNDRVISQSTEVKLVEHKK